MESRLTFFICGGLFSIMILFMAVIGISAGESILPQTWTLLSMTVMSFSMGYLYPQFKQKDERMKLIRQKGLFYAYFALIVYFFLFFLLLGLGIIDISALELLQILSCLTISTVFLSMVYVSKRI
ncbi:permease [Bacillus infantis]|uniref:permease n=1 Tax=Bacillus infantis TaxID=324767 RepID=UPI00209C725C|nr:permease [Bacillus infantis]MCP1158281.1 permease [Bacillus infantis]